MEENISIVSSSTSIWRAIAGDIELKIKFRELCPGDKLPTEQQLARKYMVNRHTVRRALTHLSSRGLLESTQGRGSFVRRPSVELRIQRRTRFSDMMRSLNASFTHHTLILDVRPAEMRVAEILQIKVGAPIVFLERLAIVNEQPIGIGRHRFSFERLPYFADMYRSRQSITGTLRDSGIPDYVRAWTKVVAQMPSVAECDLLQMPKHVPLLVTQSLNHDGLGQPLEFGDSRTAADRAELHIEPEPSHPVVDVVAEPETPSSRNP